MRRWYRNLEPFDVGAMLTVLVSLTYLAWHIVPVLWAHR